MKNLFTGIFFLLTGMTVSAQSRDLWVKSGDNGLYLEHKVAAKEGFFAIGRLYNVHPRFLAAYNKLDYNKGLQIDQKLRIPLTDTNFSQVKGSGAPVYYKTGDKEGLLTVSKKNRNVLLSSLRWWNNLSSDELKKDTKLIVGFLQGSGLPSVTIAGKPKPEEVVKQQDKPVPVVEDKPVVKVEDKPVVKPQDNPVAVNKPLDPPPVKKDTVQAPVINNEMGGNGEDNTMGFFKPYFDQQVQQMPLSKEETVTAGIFKTLSGWQDAKYYLLIDKVAPGTIVKITNPALGKSVYAKVLGEMAGIRQNQGLDIRISNAAASVLGISDTEKFIVKLDY